MKPLIVNSNRSLQEVCGIIKRNFEKYKFLSIKIDHQKRSVISNALQFHWYSELEQQGDQTSTEYRRYCKYHFGMALRAANDEFFTETMREILKKYTYEDRLKIMDFVEVTSTFDRPTMTSYLKEIKNHYTPQGFILTNSDDL